MAEERYLATARAPEPVAPDTDPSKAELQRRMEEARESITETVSEIKETITNQYQNVRESISQTLDWREQYRRRPVAFTIGAMGAGVIAGYSIAGVFIGEPGLDERYYEAEGEGYEEEEDGAQAKQTRAGGARAAAAYAPPAAYPAAESAPAPRPSYSSGYEAQAAAPAEAEPDKPGLLERFKETQAYDRLQDELRKLGTRAVEELSKTAQTVVLPLLLNKLKEMIGLDLSGGGGQKRRPEQPPTTARETNAGTTGGGQQPTRAGGAPNAPNTTGGDGSS